MITNATLTTWSTPSAADRRGERTWTDQDLPGRVRVACTPIATRRQAELAAVDLTGELQVVLDVRRWPTLLICTGHRLAVTVDGTASDLLEVVLIEPAAHAGVARLRMTCRRVSGQET